MSKNTDNNELELNECPKCKIKVPITLRSDCPNCGAMLKKIDSGYYIQPSIETRQPRQTTNQVGIKNIISDLAGLFSDALPPVLEKIISYLNQKGIQTGYKLLFLTIMLFFLLIIKIFPAQLDNLIIAIGTYSLSIFLANNIPFLIKVGQGLLTKKKLPEKFYETNPERAADLLYRHLLRNQLDLKDLEQILKRYKVNYKLYNVLLKNTTLLDEEVTVFLKSKKLIDFDKDLLRLFICACSRNLSKEIVNSLKKQLSHHPGYTSEIAKEFNYQFIISTPNIDLNLRKKVYSKRELLGKLIEIDRYITLAAFASAFLFAFPLIFLASIYSSHRLIVTFFLAMSGVSILTLVFGVIGLFIIRGLFGFGTKLYK